MERLEELDPAVSDGEHGNAYTLFFNVFVTTHAQLEDTLIEFQRFLNRSNGNSNVVNLTVRAHQGFHDSVGIRFVPSNPVEDAVELTFRESGCEGVFDEPFVEQPV